MPLLIVPPSVILLIKTSKNLFSPLFFLPTPLFVQWFTIGKPLFMAEAALAIIYIAWARNKNDLNLALLLSACSFAISCKLSALIVVLPIIIHLLTHCRLESIYKRSAALTSIIIIIPILIISLIRFYLTGNPIFPIFNDIIIPNDIDAVNFWHAVKHYKGNSSLSFPISLVLPSSHENVTVFEAPGLLQHSPFHILV